MELNSLLFPAPTVKYTAEELDGEVMYIPRFFKFSKQYRYHLKKEAASRPPKKQAQEEQGYQNLKIEENKCINDLDRIMNDLGNKKSFRDVDEKFNG